MQTPKENNVFVSSQVTKMSIEEQIMQEICIMREQHFMESMYIIDRYGVYCAPGQNFMLQRQLAIDKWTMLLQNIRMNEPEPMDIDEGQEQRKIEQEDVEADRCFEEIAQDYYDRAKNERLNYFEGVCDGEEQADGQNAENLESVSQVSSSQNITLVDERPVDNATLHTNSKQTKDINNDMTSKAWSMKAVLEREYPVANFSWENDQAVGKILFEEGVPKVITKDSTCMITRQLEFFAFARYGVRLRFQLNGYKFQCGRLIAYFKPLTWNDDREENLSGITCYPHVFLDASSSNSGVIEIPFTHLYSHFSQVSQTTLQNSTNALGRLYVRVYNTLRSPEKGSSIVYGEIYASLIRPELHLPVNEKVSFSYGDGFLQGAEAFALKLLEGFLKAGFKSLTGGLVVGGVDLLMNQIGVYDKPIDPTDGDRIINKTIASLCHGVGLDKSVRLALVPDSVTLTPPDQLGASDGDFNIDTMCKIPSLLKIATWKDTMRTGQLLYDFTITPTYIDQSFMSEDARNSVVNYQLTMLAYISRSFAMWRGPLKVKIQVIASMYHSGRLALIHDPHGTSLVDKNVFDYNRSFNTVIMDIQEKKEIEIEIPFTSIRPWQRCGRLRNDKVLPKFSKNYLDTDCNGKFRIFVLNPLVRPDNVPSQVDVNVFFYADDGFELAVPNPVSPLTTRVTAMKEQYANDPKYPYCKDATFGPPTEYSVVDNLYWQGKRLYELGRIKKFKTYWYEYAEVSRHPDVTVWIGEMQTLQQWLETTDNDNKTYCKSLPDYAPSKFLSEGEEQGVEEYTTNRDSSQASVSIDSHKKYKSAAPNTISENSMNLQTVLRRYYPLYASGILKNVVDFSLISIPVSPSFIPSEDKISLLSKLNRRYDVHNLAWFARLFTFHRGSLRYKILVNAKNSDVYVWHNPTDITAFGVKSGFSHDDVMMQLAYAGDAGVTQVQQGFEVEVPFFSGFNQLVHSHMSSKKDLRCRNGTLFVAVRNPTDHFSVSVFIAAGEDFRMNVMRAPPMVHEPWQYAYTNGSVEQDLIKYADLNYNLEHNSITFQQPGTPLFNGKAGGYFINCKQPDAMPKIEESEGEEQVFESLNPMNGINEKVDKALESVEYFKDSYSNEVLPEIQKIGTLVDEVRNMTIPTIMTKFDDLAAEAMKTSNQVNGMMPTVRDTMEHMQQFTINTAYATQEIGRAATSIKTCTEYVGELADDLSVFFKTLEYSGLWLNLVNLYKKFNFMNLMQVCINAGCLFRHQVAALAKYIYENIVATYEGFRPNVNDGGEIAPMNEQSLSELIVDNFESLNVVLAALATIVYCTLFGELPAWGVIKEYLKSKIEGVSQGAAENLRKLHFAGAGFKAIGQAFDFFKNKIQEMMNYFLGRECNAVLLERQFKEKAKEVEEWIDKIAELDDEEFFQDAQSNIDLHNKYYRLVDQGNEFTKWLMNEGVSRNVSSVIRDANRRLMEMIKKIKAIRPGHGFRYSPFVVCINGPSSTGKSDMMHKFSDLFRINLDIPYYNSVYSMPASDKYLSGYEGQPIVEWDDHLQIKDQDALVGQFINWCSNADTRVNMADIEHKGSHFNSKAFVMTSNNAFVRIEAIRDLEAYQRRRNVVINVRFAEGWDKSRMYTAPYDPDYGHAVFDIVQSWNVGGREPEVILRDLNWFQVKAYVDAQHMAWHRKQQEAMERYFESRPSLRIPSGVQIVETNEGEEQAYVVKFTKATATEEEKLDFQIFEEEFLLQDVTVQQLYFEKFKEIKKSVTAGFKKYWGLMKTKISIGFKKIYDYVSDFFVKHPTLAKGMASLGFLLSTGLLISGFTKLFQSSGLFEETYSQTISKPPPLKIVAEGGTYNNTTLVPPKLTVVAESAEKLPLEIPVEKIVRATELVVAEQGCDDPDALNVARRKVYHHLSHIGWNTENYTLLMQGLHIGGKVILAPHHFFRRAKDGEFFFILRGNSKIEIEYSSKRMVRIFDKDLCLYYLGAQIDSTKKIIDCFVSEKYLCMIAKKVSSVLVGLTPGGVMIEKACYAEGNIKMNYCGSEENAPTYTQYGWKYHINTEKGECGSALIACTKLLPPPAKIVGIHTAGYSDKSGGFSVLITREQIEAAMKVLDDRFGPQVIGCGVPIQVKQDAKEFQEQCKVVPEGDFSYYGVMNSKFCPAQPIKTNLTKTPFFEELYPSTKKPANLKVVNGVSPLRIAINKYGKLTKPFPEKFVRAVRQSIFIDLAKLKPELPAEPTSLEDAVFGKECLKYCDRMNFNSSPGWPYQCLRKGEKGKRYMFDEEKRQVIDSLLLRNIEEREKYAMMNERVPSIWRDCLKDELRPNEKVDQCKTRLFTIGPLDFNILVRKYFLSFEQAFYAGHSTFFSAVGINAESYEWTAAYNRLRTYGNLCVAGDFGGYDGTLMADLMYEVGEMINDWYELNGEKCPYAKNVRRVLIDEMIHTFQLVQNCVYKTHKGNPSGNPLTVIINTIINVFYMRLAWMCIMSERDPGSATMACYAENVIEETYGDDNKLVIKKSKIELFNQNTISQCLKEHGIEYTDETKNKVFKDYKLLEETSFLKRSYRWDPEIGKEYALPKMDIETLRALTNWTRTNLDLEEQLQANQRAILGFAFFHGREVFEEFNSGLTKKFLEYELKPLSYTYDEFLDIFMDDLQNNKCNMAKFVGASYFSDHNEGT